MKRQVFFSFHFENDFWRVQQIRNIGAIEGNAPVNPNAWEEIKLKGDAVIKAWIDDNMRYRSCVVVLAGTRTANRRWVWYEIEHAWKEGKGIVVVFIHKLKNLEGKQSIMGSNPLNGFYINTERNDIVHKFAPAGSYEIELSSVCKTYNPPFDDSKEVYNYIAEHIEDWVEEAIQIRSQYPK